MRVIETTFFKSYTKKILRDRKAKWKSVEMHADLEEVRELLRVAIENEQRLKAAEETIKRLEGEAIRRVSA